MKTRRNRSLEEQRFVILDTETTGLDPVNARLLSFGAIAATDIALDLADSVEITFRQQPAEVGETVQVHGILKSHLGKGIAPRAALHRVIEFISDAVLVGHHIDFDLKMLNKTLQEEFPGSRLKNKTIDTANLALRLEHFNDGYVYQPEDYTLDSLCQRYGISLTDRHTAAGDAFITGQLFLKLLGRCKTRKIRSLKELLKNPRMR